MVARSERGMMEAGSDAARSLEARYFDGRSAAAYRATLRWSDAFLSIDGVAGELAVWPRARLIVGEPDPDGRVTLSCQGELGRVSTGIDALPPEIAAQVTTPRKRRRQYLGWALVGVGHAGGSACAGHETAGGRRGADAAQRRKPARRDGGNGRGRQASGVRRR
ncbi:DUF7092 domain-containing protein [Paraburkholderia bryophila]|uniref:DUF7092 domain-containing protein n=1 Tax=Paraburkholderia bryophila TaxID=420952 RepID=A0A7Y9W6H4_9BURK|nr:hypothetical protein [Paraburkholderia bryophila]NYH15085.1 hypothetical protein [Paraburkholderia bryophila]